VGHAATSQLNGFDGHINASIGIKQDQGLLQQGCGGRCCQGQVRLRQKWNEQTQNEAYARLDPAHIHD
jgi:hypothetical protein